MQFPGPKSQKLLQEFDKYTSSNKKPFVIDLEKCHDSYLVTVDGQEILDFENHYASKLIAYNHSGLFEPYYIKKLTFAANNKTANPDHVTPELVEYYKTLHEIAPKCMKENGNVDIMCFNSGAEAVENAMKYCINLYYEKHKDNIMLKFVKPCFISFDKAFHGRSVYTLGVTDMPHNLSVTQWFKELTVDNIKLPFPAIGEDYYDPYMTYEDMENECIEQLESVLNTENGHRIAGIITEDFQGAGGHRVAKSSYFQRMMKIAKKYDITVIFDSVQSAGGPTGNYFMCDSFYLPYPPTVVCSAKKFGCGVVYFLNPMANPGILDSTWSGSLVDMVRFVQEIKIVRQENLIEQVAEKSDYLIEKLNELVNNHYNMIFNPRGAGLYQGFSVHNLSGFESANKFRNWITEIALQQENLLLMWAGSDSIRLRPTLHVTKNDIDSLIERLGRVLESAKSIK